MRWIVLFAACSLAGLAWQVEAPGTKPIARAERSRPPLHFEAKPAASVPAPESAPSRPGGQKTASSQPEAVHAARDAGAAKSVLVEPVAVDALTGERLACTIERIEAKPPKPERLVRGKVATLRFLAHPPRGHVAERSAQSAEKVYLSRLASRIRFLLPLRRELELQVVVTEPDGSPAAGAKLDEVVMGGPDPVPGRFRPEIPEEEPEIPEEEPEEFGVGAPQGATIYAQAAPAGADGILQVRAVPFLQGERYLVLVSKQERTAFAELLLGEQPDPRTLFVRLPGARTSLGFGIGANGCLGWG